MAISSYLTEQELQNLLDQQFADDQGVAGLLPSNVSPFFRMDATGGAFPLQDFRELTGPQIDFGSTLSTPDLASDIPTIMNPESSTPQQNFQFQTSAYEDDEEGDEEALKEKPSGIARLFELYQKFSPVNFLKQLLPEQDPRAINMRNFYGSQFGLTPTGSLASGIMAGYNPISGGLFGTPVNYGLASAARDRINRIANRKIAQTDASRAKIAELQKFARADEISRARQAAPDVYEKASSLGLTDSSGGFKSAGTNEAFSNKTGRGRTGY